MQFYSEEKGFVGELGLAAVVYSLLSIYPARVCCIITTTVV